MVEIFKAQALLFNLCKWAKEQLQDMCSKLWALKTRKEIVFSLIKGEDLQATTELGLTIPQIKSRGIGFSIALIGSGRENVSIPRTVLGGKICENGTSIAICNVGFAEAVMDITKINDFTAGQLLTLVAQYRNRKKYGVYVTPDKEMVLIVVPSELEIKS